MAGQESLPGEINGLRDVKVTKFFLRWKAKLWLSLDTGMRTELQNTSGWLWC